MTVPNHPNTPPIPMSIPMTYLFPVSKDPVTGEAKYKMLVPRNGGGDPSMVGGFPPMIPFPSPPLLPHMIPLPPLHRPETEPTPDKSKKSKIPPKTRELPQESGLKVEVKEGSDISAPLDLTHRYPNCTVLYCTLS